MQPQGPRSLGPHVPLEPSVLGTARGPEMHTSMHTRRRGHTQVHAHMHEHTDKPFCLQAHTEAGLMVAEASRPGLSALRLWGRWGVSGCLRVLVEEIGHYPWSSDPSPEPC